MEIVTYKGKYSFHRYSEDILYSGTICIYFIMDWMERRQGFANTYGVLT